MRNGAEPVRGRLKQVTSGASTLFVRVDAERRRTRKGFGANKLPVLSQLDRTRKSIVDKALVLSPLDRTRKSIVDKALVHLRLPWRVESAGHRVTPDPAAQMLSSSERFPYWSGKYAAGPQAPPLCEMLARRAHLGHLARSAQEGPRIPREFVAEGEQGDDLDLHFECS